MLSIFNQIIDLIVCNFDKIITIGMFIIAFYAMIVNAKSYSEQNRPYITFSYEEHKEGNYYYLIVRNTGVRAAYEVTIDIEPILQSYLIKEREPISQIKFDFIAPNQIIKYCFDYSLFRHNEENGAKDEKHKIDLEYKYKSRKYKETYNIDLTYLKTWIGSDIESKSTKHLKDIAENIKNINTQLGKKS